MIDFSAQTGATRTIRFFLLFLIIIGIVLLIARDAWVPSLVSFLLRNDYPNVNEETTLGNKTLKELYPEIVTEGYSVDYTYGEGQQNDSSKKSLTFVSPSGEKIIVPDPIWLQISPATAVDKMPNASTQRISGIVAINPLNAREVIVSTYEQVPESSEIWRSIYSYNFDTYGLTQLYTDISAESILLSNIATDGSKLILASSKLKDEKTCTNVWSGENELLYLDMANIGVGLTPYIPPKELTEAGEREADKCK